MLDVCLVPNENVVQVNILGWNEEKFFLKDSWTIDITSDDMSKSEVNATLKLVALESVVDKDFGM